MCESARRLLNAKGTKDFVKDAKQCWNSILISIKMLRLDFAFFAWLFAIKSNNVIKYKYG